MSHEIVFTSENDILYRSSDGRTSVLYRGIREHKESNGLHNFMTCDGKKITHLGWTEKGYKYQMHKGPIVVHYECGETSEVEIMMYNTVGIRILSSNVTYRGWTFAFNYLCDNKYRVTLSNQNTIVYTNDLEINNYQCDVVVNDIYSGYSVDITTVSDISDMRKHFVILVDTDDICYGYKYLR